MFLLQIVCNPSLLQPVTSNTVILNSLASEVKVISEPMECNLTPVDSPLQTKCTSNNSLDVPMAENSNCVDQQVSLFRIVIFILVAFNFVENNHVRIYFSEQ